MSSVTPGRETDAKVAEAIGGKLLPSSPWEKWDEPPRIRLGCRFTDGQVMWGVDGDWSPSTSPADALAALEATGEPWGLVFQKGGKYGCNIGTSHTWHYGETLCLAVCAAILAWSGAKGGE